MTRQFLYGAALRVYLDGLSSGQCPVRVAFVLERKATCCILDSQQSVTFTGGS